MDSSGNAYVAGQSGEGLRVSSSAFQKAFHGGVTGDGFVTKLNSSDTGMMWSTYLGGCGNDWITALALDQHRTVYVTGVTALTDFPLKAPVVAAQASLLQPFVTTLSPSLSSIAYYSTLLGNKADDYLTYFQIRAIAVDKVMNTYVAGTTSGGVQPTPGALMTGAPVNPGGSGDAFVSKLVIMDDMAMAISASPNVSVIRGVNLTYTLARMSKGPDFGYYVRIDDPLPAGTTFVSFAATRGKCTAPAIGTTSTLRCTLQHLDKGDTFIVSLTVKVNAPAGSTLSNMATTGSDMQDFVPANKKASFSVKVN